MTSRPVAAATARLAAAAVPSFVRCIVHRRVPLPIAGEGVVEWVGVEDLRRLSALAGTAGACSQVPPSPVLLAKPKQIVTNRTRKHAGTRRVWRARKGSIAWLT